MQLNIRIDNENNCYNIKIFVYLLTEWLHFGGASFTSLTDKINVENYRSGLISRYLSTITTENVSLNIHLRLLEGT